MLERILVAIGYKYFDKKIMPWLRVNAKKAYNYLFLYPKIDKESNKYNEVVNKPDATREERKNAEDDIFGG